jgi:hypothetical protein
MIHKRWLVHVSKTAAAMLCGYRFHLRQDHFQPGSYELDLKNLTVLLDGEEIPPPPLFREISEYFHAETERTRIKMNDVHQALMTIHLRFAHSHNPLKAGTAFLTRLFKRSNSLTISIDGHVSLKVRALSTDFTFDDQINVY